MAANDVVGERGEWLCQLALTRKVGGTSLFLPRFLGEKWPVVDLLVDVRNPPAGGPRPFFFAQVKSTQQGYQPNGRLKIPSVAREAAQALAAYPVPAYLLGVDEPQGRVYIVAVQGTIAGMSSMSAAHELTEARLERLRDEVVAFWAGVARPTWTSAFPEEHWQEAP